jgi:hypothetical protein
MSARALGRGGEYESRCRLSDFEMQHHQDAGVGVGGQHDRRVSELFLDGPEVGPGGVRQSRGAVAQVMQPYRRQT